jgi:hypothetical protein
MSSAKVHWLLRARTSQLFYLSSVVVLVVACLIVVLANLAQYSGFDVSTISPVFYLPIGAVFAVNGICSTLILVGMLWYWVRFDYSPRTVKLLWFALFFLLGWLAMSIYYFAVYRPQRRLAVREDQ